MLRFLIARMGIPVPMTPLSTMSSCKLCCPIEVNEIKKAPNISHLLIGDTLTLFFFNYLQFKCIKELCMYERCV